MKVAVVTDSTAYLPADLIEHGRIEVIPLTVVVEGRDHREGVEISTREVARALRAFVPVSTSRPAPRLFLDSYTKLADRGFDAVVSVHLSGAMSGTVESAQLAAADSPIAVEVVDSRVLGMAMGYAVVSAADAASRGMDMASVGRIARERAAAATSVFYVHTLEYLRRGGRIGKASALLGTALAVKPLLSLVDGQIEPLEKVRTMSRGLARIEQRAVAAARQAGAVDIAVHHLDAAAPATVIAARLREQLPGVDVLLVELGAAVGAHVGPGTIAVVVSPRPPGASTTGPGSG